MWDENKQWSHYNECINAVAVTRAWKLDSFKHWVGWQAYGITRTIALHKPDKKLTQINQEHKELVKQYARDLKTAYPGQALVWLWTKLVKEKLGKDDRSNMTLSDEMEVVFSNQAKIHSVTQFALYFQCNVDICLQPTAYPQIYGNENTTLVLGLWNEIKHIFLFGLCHQVSLQATLKTFWRPEDSGCPAGYQTTGSVIFL